MQILWHSQIATTMEIYSEVPTAKTRSASSGRAGNSMASWRCCTSTERASLVFRNRPEVELRGFEPLTPSMRTKGSRVQMAARMCHPGWQGGGKGCGLAQS